MFMSAEFGRLTSLRRKLCARKEPTQNLFKGKRFLWLVLAATMVLSSCTINHKPRGFTFAVAEVDPVPTASKQTDKPRKIAIFFDGTANDEGSDTNVKRLHSLITLQDRGDIASLYILGVGTDMDAVGAATGSGINARVKIAYEFILNHYRAATADRKADEIYIFGFSRGAYSARILTTMLYFAGIVEEVHIPGNSRRYSSTEIAEATHKALFPGFMRGDVNEHYLRPADIAAKLNALPNRLQSAVDYRGSIPVPVKLLGLWDTVEALGVFTMAGQRIKLASRSTPPKVNTDNPNRRYGERLCNVEFAFHALSIDDNRATVFTPLLLSRAHLYEGCFGINGYAKASTGHAAFISPMLDGDGNIARGRLQEVWFSGAHSDVGGGYLDSELSGVSLNWMLNQVRRAAPDLLPKRIADTAEEQEPVRYVRENALGRSHDPTTGIWATYPRITRDLVGYASQQQSLWGQELCVHKSVFTRRGLIGFEAHEYDQLELTAPKEVQLALGPYGKGRQWMWLRQRASEDKPSIFKDFSVKEYPNCTFIEKSTRWGDDK